MSVSSQCYTVSFAKTKAFLSNERRPLYLDRKKTKAILALWALFHVFVLISELGFLYSTEYEDENDDIVNSSVVKAPLGSKYIRLPFKMISNIYFLIRKG